jgi:hypothetical protein
MKTRLLLVATAIIFLIIGLILRSSYQRTTNTMAAQVQAQDNLATDPAASIAALKTYVQQHGGTHAEFTLLAGYQRAVTAAQTAAAAQATNSQIYAAAQMACGGKTDSITQAKCNAQFLSQHLVSVPTTAPVDPPQKSSFIYSFVGPVMTSDLSGLSFLASLMLLLGAGSTFLIRRHG